MPLLKRAVRNYRAAFGPVSQNFTQDLAATSENTPQGYSLNILKMSGNSDRTCLSDKELANSLSGNLKSMEYSCKQLETLFFSGAATSQQPPPKVVA
jgi:hypothetical protein